MKQMYIYKTDFEKISDKPLTDKCIVLDLDETLVHSNPEPHIDTLKSMKIFNNPEYLDLRKRIYKIDMDDVVYKKGEGIKTEMWGITRPHLKEFLIFCFSYFKIVIIWSAGRKNYVNAIVDFIFKDLKRPLIVWDYNNLDKLSNNTLIKPLKKMSSNVLGLEKYMDLSNTFIVDDRLSVFEDSNPNNGILIPQYKPNFDINNMRKDDETLIQLMNWFKNPKVINSKDIRTLDKSNIFNNKNNDNTSVLSPN